MMTTSPIQISDLLKLQAEALYKTSCQIQPVQAERALVLLASCRGKVILSGVGKSGIIAQKIAATLTSVGTLSITLHPCDALHGDIGIVTRDDVVMMLSNSGKTEELLNMLPHLKLREVPIIAIVGNLNSTLAKQADVVLDASVDREACPLNLAPTTSTTVALAIGDALAMTVMQMKGLTPEAFAVNHPAGRLGKRLTLRIADLMHGGKEAPTLTAETPWLEVVLAIGQGGLGAVSVVDDGGHLLGLITDGDIRRSVRKTQSTELDFLTAEMIMTPNPVVITPEVLAFDALKIMEERDSQISVLPVVDAHKRSIGLIRLHDIIRSGL
ncbi:KpsF/GutQ family sugar-phosphate isomerase [Umezakia ovalisporum]|uniref:KpsF/GutQ family sugar-phosphate isomerase n=1 Tax=Umezakia ovalisporum TaxID=75695 RepID=UPI0035BB7ADE